MKTTGNQDEQNQVRGALRAEAAIDGANDDPATARHAISTRVRELEALLDALEDAPEQPNADGQLDAATEVDPAMRARWFEAETERDLLEQWLNDNGGRS